jgi:L-threonylcarbamoyladenylate synthase
VPGSKRVGADVEHAAQILKEGKLVGIPTETVYGLAANALDPTAVLGIFKAKNRPTFDPLIVHVKSLEHAREFVQELPPNAKELAERFWPGPLTLILKKKDIIPDVVTSGLPFVGIRVPNHPMTQRLLSQLDFPLSAPSANPFKYVSPTTAEHVLEQLGNQVNYVLDGGPCSVGVESTIVSFVEDVPKVLRLGGLTIETLEKVLGEFHYELHQGSNPTAPGQLDKHYATLKPIELVNELPGEKEPRTTYIGFGGNLPISIEFNLSENADYAEAAQNLFDVLRRADKSDSTKIVVMRVPDVGLGRAINDRLKRAAF